MAIKENYNKILTKIGNKSSMVAVVKSQSNEDIQELFDLGQRIFAENKVQDFLDKYEYFKKNNIEWHFIGHLQRNKVKYMIDKVSLIHSLDSFRLGEEISKRALSENKVMDCLVQINTGNEENKYGIEFEDCEDFISSLESLKGIRILGLMAVTPYSENPENSRLYFKKMKSLFEKVKEHKYNNAEMTYLSMGMSNDYEVAIEEGANIVRVGSLLFY